MQKNLIIGVVIIALAGVIVLAYLARMGTSESSEKMDGSAEKMMADDQVSPEGMMEKEVVSGGDSMMKKDDGAMMEGSMSMSGGQYLPYQEEKLAFAKEGKVLLFFNASWCPQCRAIEQDIKASLGDIPKNLLILSVDYDSMSDLKKRYNVVTQHTFVQVDANGNELTKWVGGTTLEEIVGRVK